MWRVSWADAESEQSPEAVIETVETGVEEDEAVEAEADTTALESVEEEPAADEVNESESEPDDESTKSEVEKEDAGS